MNTWNINGKILEFIEDEHIYLYNGMIVPSVTQILSCKFKDEYNRISKKVLENAAAKGTALHEAIEMYEREGQDCNLIEFKNYLFLKDRKHFKNIDNEVPVVYIKNGKALYVGRLDQIIMIGGKLAINDFKRVSAPNKEKIAYQLNLYKLAYEQTYNKKIEGLYFTHLREEVRKFVPLPINEKAALELVDQYYKGE